MTAFGKFISMAVLGGMMTMAPVAHAEEDPLARYEALTALEKKMIDDNCEDTRQWESSYKVCLKNTINALQTPGKPDISDMGPEMVEETELACAGKLLFGGDLYHKCLVNSQKELAEESYRPDLSAMKPEEKEALELECENSKHFGPGSYNRCLRHNFAKLRDVSFGTNELWDLPPDQKSTVRAVCEIEIFSGTAASYSQCLTEEAAVLLGKPIPGQKHTDATTGLTPAEKQEAKARPLEEKAQRTVQASLDTLKTEPVPAPSTASLPGMPGGVSDTPLAPDRLYASAAPSVYVVLAGVSPEDFKAQKDISQGSAVAVASRFLLTNCHVTEGRPYLLLIQGRDVQPARLVQEHKDADRCIIESMNDVNPVKGVRMFGKLNVGERIYTIGTPSGLERTLSEGLISGLRENEPYGKLVQISAPISPGSSGGGLFDSNGNLIGITTFGLTNTGQLNFALSADQYWH